MPGSMPLHVQRGPYVAALELFAKDKASLIAARQALRDPAVDLASVVDFGAVDPAYAAHLRADWYETTPGPNGPTRAAFSASNTTTGFWTGYHGDVHEIVRLTLHTGIDVALGIPWDTPNAEVATKAKGEPKPALLLWVCPSPWFGGYVSWADAQVTVVFHTPSNGDPVDRDYRHSPDLDTTTASGHVVITHRRHRWWRQDLHVGTPIGDIAIPLANGVRGTGRVVRQQEGGGTAGGVGPDGGARIHIE